MPWNRVYYPPGSLSPEARDAIAKGITDIYAESYPQHSTIVTFNASPDLYLGGERSTRIIRVTLQHMQGSYSTAEKDNNFRPRMSAVLKPWIQDKGMGYELQISQIPGEEISFDTCTFPSSVLSTAVFRQMVQDDTLYPVELRENKVTVSLIVLE